MKVKVVLTSSQTRKCPVGVQVLSNLLPETSECPGRQKTITHTLLLTLVTVTMTLVTLMTNW